MGPSKCLIACISGPWHFAPIHSARFHDSLSLVLALSPQERTHTSLPHRHSIWFRFPASTSINLPRCCRYRLWSLPPIIHLPPFIHPRHLCQRICDRLCILQFNPVVIHPNNHRFPNPSAAGSIGLHLDLTNPSPAYHAIFTHRSSTRSVACALLLPINTLPIL